MSDYLKYYHLETYLFETVRKRFHDVGGLGAFDFFCIVVWKANRAKSKVARKLIKHDPQGRITLDPIVAELTASLFKAKEDKERLRILVEDWGFRLPMASAILTVLWPDDFTVYDQRVCNELQDFHSIGNKSNFDKLWLAYLEFKESVEAGAPHGLQLRDKDRHLWGKSFHNQLRGDIRTLFERAETASASRPNLCDPWLKSRRKT
jgi:hypothetical protein